MASWLAESDEGKGELSLFCVFGSHVHGGVPATSASPAVKKKKKSKKEGNEKRTLPRLNFLFNSDLQYFSSPQESIHELHVDAT